MMILPLLNFKEYVPSEIEAQVQAVDWTLAARYTFLFNLVYFMLQWHLGSRSYPKSPSVCSIPRPSLMPLYAGNEKRCPRLMHTKAHSFISHFL
jgi:hypothetical protein